MTPDQALRLEAAKVAATMPARLQVIRVEAPKEPTAAGLSDLVTRMMAVWGCQSSQKKLPTGISPGLHGRSTGTQETSRG